MITCPKCGSEKFFYRQECAEYSYIEEIHEEGWCELGEVVDTYHHDDQVTLQCDECGVELTIDEYLAMKEVVEEETKAQAEEVAND